MAGASRGENLFFDLYTKSSTGQWSRYKTITNSIAQEEIDSYLVYRLILPIYRNWSGVGIYQRNLEKYNESVVFNGDSCMGVCVNCHSFNANNPEKMLLGIRSGDIGSSTILAEGEDAKKIDTKFGYTAWHPSGKLAVYSMNMVRQFIHNAGTQIRDVLDLDSALCYYKVDSQMVKTTEAFSKKDRLESYPAWSPDGKYMYFVAADKPWDEIKTMPPEGYDTVKYDLMRIGYDIEMDAWSKPETILSSKETGLSILLPRVSPDGKFLLFTMCDYGCFPVYRDSSDLYLMDLQTGDYRKLDINSEYSESWHSFSSNSRWIAFSSKRNGGLFTRTYFSYIDQDGKAHKPFIMPQKDPLFYDSYLKTYSVPELVTGKVEVSQKTIDQAVRSAEQANIDIPITSATMKASDQGPWQERE